MISDFWFAQSRPGQVTGRACYTILTVSCKFCNKTVSFDGGIDKGQIKFLITDFSIYS